MAIISAASALISGVAVAFAKPTSEDFAARRRERRQRRLTDLDRMAEAIFIPGEGQFHTLRVLAGSISDQALKNYVGRFIAPSSEKDRSDARADAAHRIGELRRRV